MPRCQGCYADVGGEAKEIGSSLEAELKIELNSKLKSMIDDVDFSELCITSKAEVIYKNNLEVKATTNKAKGFKCPVCWKITESSCSRHP